MNRTYSSIQPNENIPNENDGILKKKVHDNTEVEVKIPEGVQPPETEEVETHENKPETTDKAAQTTSMKPMLEVKEIQQTPIPGEA